MSDLEAFRALVALLANDGFAMSFQSLGQYRGALLREATLLLDQAQAAALEAHL